MIIDMKGKVVLVTGASQGLGETIAIEFAKCHADVVVNYNSQQSRAEDVAKRIRSLGQKALAIKCNVAHSVEVKSMVEEILSSFKRIDVLVNNAAVNPKRPEGKTPVYKITEEEWDFVMGVNLKGTFNCSQCNGQPKIWIYRQHLFDVGSDRKRSSSGSTLLCFEGGHNLLNKGSSIRFGNIRDSYQCGSPWAY
jgi:3-oxoacyl-[acyl-carrier protein] reductase